MSVPFCLVALYINELVLVGTNILWLFRFILIHTNVGVLRMPFYAVSLAADPGVTNFYTKAARGTGTLEN